MNDTKLPTPEPAKGMFYRVVSREELPAWMRDDAAKHMAKLTTMLGIPEEEIEWFIPALTDEIPEQLWEHVDGVLREHPHKSWIVFRSDAYCDPPVTNPVYFWRNIDVLGLAESGTSADPGHPRVHIRADINRNGRQGLGWVMAHELFHRKQAYDRKASERSKRGRARDLDRVADQFAKYYVCCFMLDQDGVTDRVTMSLEDDEDLEVEIA